MISFIEKEARCVRISVSSPVALLKVHIYTESTLNKVPYATTAQCMPTKFEIGLSCTYTS